MPAGDAAPLLMWRMARTARGRRDARATQGERMSALRSLTTRALRAGQTRAVLRRAMNDGDRQIGDYPNLPFVSRQFADPYAHWDKQDRRERDAGVPEQDEVLGPWTYDQDPFTSKWEALGTLLIAFAGVGFVAWLAGKFDAAGQKPTAKRTLPFNNLETELGPAAAAQAHA